MKTSCLIIILIVLTIIYSTFYHAEQVHRSWFNKIKKAHKVWSAIIFGAISASSIAIPMYMTGNQICGNIINLFAKWIPNALPLTTLEIMSGLVGIFGGAITTIPLTMSIIFLIITYKQKGKGYIKAMVEEVLMILLFLLITFAECVNMYDPKNFGETGFIIGLLIDIAFSIYVSKETNKGATNR